MCDSWRHNGFVKQELWVVEENQNGHIQQKFNSCENSVIVQCNFPPQYVYRIRVWQCWKWNLGYRRKKSTALNGAYRIPEWEVLDTSLPAWLLPIARHDQLFANVKETFLQQTILNPKPNTIDIIYLEDSCWSEKVGSIDSYDNDNIYNI